MMKMANESEMSNRQIIMINDVKVSPTILHGIYPFRLLTSDCVGTTTPGCFRTTEKGGVFGSKFSHMASLCPHITSSVSEVKLMWNRDIIKSFLVMLGDDYKGFYSLGFIMGARPGRGDTVGLWTAVNTHSVRLGRVLQEFTWSRRGWSPRNLRTIMEVKILPPILVPYLSNYHTPSQTSNYCCFFNFLFKNKYRSTRNCKTDRTPNVTTVLNSCYGISGNVNIQSDTNIEYFSLCFIPMVSYHTQFGTSLLWTGCFSFPKLICWSPNPHCDGVGGGPLGAG